MLLDDEICYCLHVSLRKLAHYSRREQVRRPSQMAGCLGAGTGCGWCIPFLEKIARDPAALLEGSLEAEEYAARRRTYIHTGQPKNQF